jgi:hypothetical protein
MRVNVYGEPAMEPRLGGRGDFRGDDRVTFEITPAMEPRLGGRGDPSRFSPPLSSGNAKRCEGSRPAHRGVTLCTCQGVRKPRLACMRALTGGGRITRPLASQDDRSTAWKAVYVTLPDELETLVPSSSRISEFDEDEGIDTMINRMS